MLETWQLSTILEYFQKLSMFTLFLPFFSSFVFFWNSNYIGFALYLSFIFTFLLYFLISSSLWPEFLVITGIQFAV